MDTESSAKTGRLYLNANVILNFLLKEPQLLLTIFLIGFTALANPYFLTPQNFLLVLRQSSINGILTCGMCWMMISGSFDLSVGALISFISVTMITMLQGGTNYVVVILVGLIIGSAAGLVNGILVGKLKANAFLVTLGTMTIFQGMALLVTGGLYSKVPNNSPFTYIGDGYIGALAVPSLLFLFIALIMQLILSETAFGGRIYAIGGNEEAAKLAGVSVGNYRVLMYLTTGITSAIAAMVLSARAGSASDFIGLNYEFFAITAAVLGGNYIFGGRGSVGRGVWGALLLALLGNALTLLGLHPPTQLIAQGLVTVCLVAIQVLFSKRDN